MPEVVRLESQIAIDCLVFCDKSRTGRMCNHSRPWLAKDLLRDGIAHKFLDMGLAQPDLCSKFREGSFTANGEGMGKTKTRDSVQADLSGCQNWVGYGA